MHLPSACASGTTFEKEHLKLAVLHQNQRHIMQQALDQSDAHGRCTVRLARQRGSEEGLTVAFSLSPLQVEGSSVCW